ncbi:MAG TPA: hypothetical protein VIT44_06320, partial [Cyclobacteriaceae bacterium]
MIRISIIFFVLLTNVICSSGKGDPGTDKWIAAFKERYELNSRSKSKSYLISTEPVKQYTANGGFDLVDVSSEEIKGLNKKLEDFNTDRSNNASFYVFVGSIYLDYEKKPLSDATDWEKMEAEFMNSVEVAKEGGLKSETTETQVKGLVESISKEVVSFSKGRGDKDIILLYALRTFYALPPPNNYRIGEYYLIDLNHLSDDLKNKFKSIQFLTKPTLSSTKNNAQWLDNTVDQVLDAFDKRSADGYAAEDCSDEAKQNLLDKYADSPLLKSDIFRAGILENPCVLAYTMNNDWRDDWMVQGGYRVLKDERLLALTKEKKEKNWQSQVDFLSQQITNSFLAGSLATNTTDYTFSNYEWERLQDRFNILRSKKDKLFLFAVHELDFFIDETEKEKLIKEVSDKVQIKIPYVLIVTFYYKTLRANLDYSRMEFYDRNWFAKTGALAVDDVPVTSPAEKLSYARDLYLKYPKPRTVFPYYLEYSGKLIEQATFQSKGDVSGADMYEFVFAYDTRIEEYINKLKQIRDNTPKREDPIQVVE